MAREAKRGGRSFLLLVMVLSARPFQDHEGEVVGETKPEGSTRLRPQPITLFVPLAAHWPSRET